MIHITLIAVCLVLGVQCLLPIEQGILENQPEAGGQIWAVIIAGSNNWYNYRHQSDVSHLYHLLTKKHGIPKKNVITFMYNDIAFNEENPYPGTIINALHGKDVYEGVMIDYMNKDVSPENFLAVLQGKRMRIGSMKTLKSGPKDMVFVNFVDHGGPGILGFPAGELHLKDLTATLEFMQSSKMYQQMLWYVEACYSGSMFEKLSADWNITAHTAANTDESSYACVKDDDIGVYLGDCWSLNWMNNTEQIWPNLSSETVQQQFDIVKKMTTESHASLYGDLTYIPAQPISVFMGHGTKDEKPEPVRAIDIHHHRTATPDVMLEYYRSKLDKSENAEEQKQLEELINYHVRTEGKVQEIIEEISHQVTGSWEVSQVFSRTPQHIRHPSCNKDVLTAFFGQCYRMQSHPYITKYLYKMTNLCNAYGSKVIVDAVLDNCNHN